ncbi:hypothetical protein PG993_013437 [Apiospora rasikravindrae]|uniref:DUF7730 domain-containing protein n=1 Tax=Apiospora rasikravindrae TaxID=990691 RepID=A0ABR1RZ12_9PEZI
MSFLTLPTEIRNLIYHDFLLDSAAAQHVAFDGRTNHYARLPCQSIPDHVFLQDLSRICGDKGWGDSLGSLRTSAWRNGHLACEPRTVVHSGERLPSPTPLFLTCRQVYREAATYIYNTPLMFHDWDTFKSFLSRTEGRAIPARLTSVHIVEQLSRGDFPVGRDFIYTLACLDLSSTTIRILGPLGSYVGSLLYEAMARALWHKAVAIEIFDPRATEVETARPANGCPVVRRPDAAWVLAFNRYLSKSGGVPKTRDVLGELSSYAVLEKVAGELGLSISDDA